MNRLIRTSCAVALGMGVIAGAQFATAEETLTDAPQVQTEQPVLAQTVPEQMLEKIEITGSIIKRIEGETALPVAIVTREEIQKSGASTVEELMQILPVFSSASNTVSAQNAGATTGGLAAVSLHGLGSTRTLVLINGRRTVPYGILTDSTSVDVNSIPIAAIERIEILKEGASATYGSDAIAGVVNFILRKNYRGVEATAEYGNSTSKHAATEKATLTYGFGELATDRFNVMLTASVERDEELWGRNRSFAANGINQPYDNTSSNTFPGNITPLTGPLAGTRLNPGFPNNCAPASNDPVFLNLPNFSQCRFDPSPYVPLLPQMEHESLFGSFSYALTRDWTAYAEFSYNRNMEDQLEQPSPVSYQFALPANNPLANQFPYNVNAPAPSVTAIYLAPTSPYYPFAYISAAGGAPGGVYPTLNVNYRTFYNGGRGLTDTTSTPRIVLGMKGTALGWDTDTSFVYASNLVSEVTRGGWWIQSQMLPLLNSGNINLLYPALGPAPSAAQIAQMQATNYYGKVWDNKTTIDDLTVRGTRDLVSLSGGPMALGLGAEVRRESFDYEPNALLQDGDLSGFGGNSLPENKSRNVYAAFAEVDAPFLKSLEADLSARFDHYEGVGSKTTPKLGLRWQPMAEVLVRGSIGKGFRAPSLTDLYMPQAQNVTTTLTDPADCINNVGFGCAVQITTLIGGNPNLKPETSTNVTWGVVLEPLKNLSTSIDFFNIEVKNAIAQGGLNPAFIFSNLSSWGYLVSRGGHDPALPASCTTCDIATLVNELNLNLGAERVTGFDFDFRWMLPTDPETGRITVALHGTYYAKFQSQNPDNSYSDEIDTANQTISANGGIVPRWKHRAEVDWQKNSWDVLVAQNWQGTYADLGQAGNFVSSACCSTVGTYETYDLNVGYVGFKDWKVNLGVKNIFDEQPPYTGAGGALYFQNGYDPSYADPRGRFVYLEVGYKFK